MQPGLYELQRRPDPSGDRMAVAVGAKQLQGRWLQIQLHVLQSSRCDMIPARVGS